MIEGPACYARQAQTTCRVASAVSHATIVGKPLLAEQPDAPVLDDYWDWIKELLL